MNCGKCDVDLSTLKEKIGCSGFCNRAYHYGCAEVDRTSFNVTLKCANIMWFCNDCRDLIKNKMFLKMFSPNWNIPNQSQINIAQQEMVKCLQKEIGANKENISLILKKIETADKVVFESRMKPPNHQKDRLTKGKVKVVSDLCGTTPQAESTTKPPNIDSSKASTSKPDNICLISPPNGGEISETNTQKKISNQQAVRGSNILPDMFIKTVPQKFWLHLSRLDTQTTEEDVLAMANKCLGTSFYHVGKLIPKTKKIQDLEYLCFKLGINEDLKDKALSSETWPTGVYIRPFKNQNFRKAVASNVKFRNPTVEIGTPRV